MRMDVKVWHLLVKFSQLLAINLGSLLGKSLDQYLEMLQSP